MKFLFCHEKKPASLEKLVELTAAQIGLPMTVKIRLGVSEEKINVHKYVAISLGSWNHPSSDESI